MTTEKRKRGRPVGSGRKHRALRNSSYQMRDKCVLAVARALRDCLRQREWHGQPPNEFVFGVATPILVEGAERDGMALDVTLTRGEDGMVVVRARLPIDPPLEGKLDPADPLGRNRTYLNEVGERLTKAIGDSLDKPRYRATTRDKAITWQDLVSGTFPPRKLADAVLRALPRVDVEPDSARKAVRRGKTQPAPRPLN